MYSTSGGASRKLTGTRMRPLPLTPKKLVSSRAEFWLTMATRSPWPIPSASSPAAWARARSATCRQVSSPQDAAGWSGSSITPIRSA